MIGANSIAFDQNLHCTKVYRLFFFVSIVPVYFFLRGKQQYYFHCFVTCFLSFRDVVYVLHK
ncbi:hypothetical protein K501DRAFT_30046 [Backusella circina FSU 941]|nr:hypothetical protein K501DRAFT_30046 [Backusella circina FSU 941]